MVSIGRELGWPIQSRNHFETQVGPLGAHLIGGPKEVAEKILRHSQALGGTDRVTLQMDAANLPRAKLMNSIQLIAEHVAPVVRP